MADAKQIVVLGAGLAGLAAAYRLRRNPIQIFESSKIVGGLCVTQEKEGYRFDRTGHLLHFRHSRIRKVVAGLLAEEPLRIDRKSRIFSSGVYTHYPFQSNTFGLPKPIVAECLQGFIDAQISAGSTASATPASFESFILKHFGAAIARHFMIPYNHKLWGVHPREITPLWCQRFVPIPTIQEVIHGAIGLSQDSLGYNASFLYPKRGIGELTAAFARRVGPIQLRHEATSIDYVHRRVWVRGRWVEYSNLISTIPLNKLLCALVDPPPFVASAIGKLRCSSLRYLNVALDCPVGNDFHWTYVPEARYPFYRVGSYSNFSAAMAPRKKGSLYVELATRNPRSMARQMPKVIAGLIEMKLFKNASDIRFVVPEHIPHAYVIYDNPYEATVPPVLHWLAQHGIHCAGRYARWQYTSMEDAIVEGFAAADQARKSNL